MPHSSRRASVYGEKDVWGIFTPLANEHKAVNLGQGFPNIPAPHFIKEAADSAIKNDLNQYAPSKGLPRLLKEIIVTQGANQGIAVTMQAVIDPGDEVILIAPFFDIYKPSIELAGGRIVSVPLRLERAFDKTISANEWTLNLDELVKKITPKTKAILINNPHNPTGKLFSLDELKAIAAIAKRHNLLVFSDEVYDRLVYEGEMHRIGALPDMWERTITFGSGGKTFGVTGWRIGWVIGPSHLLKYILAVHARTVFTTPTPLQDAVAAGFEHCMEKDYFKENREDLQRRRDRAIQIFTDLGLPVSIPHGAYFFLVETSKIKVNLPAHYSEESQDGAVLETRDYLLCRWLTTNIGVAAIPPSAFYEECDKHLVENMIRICFCKNDQTLEEAAKRLRNLQPFIKTT